MNQANDLDGGLEFDHFGSPIDEACEDEAGAAYGDPRRCPRHPGVATSSLDGLFDTPCHLCEGELDAAEEASFYDPENSTRLYCSRPFLFLSLGSVKCVDAEQAVGDDDIPF